MPLGMAQETCCTAGFTVHTLQGRARLDRTAQQQSSNRESQDLECQKDIDTSIKPCSPVTGCHHEHVVRRCLQEMLVEIGTQRSRKENQRDPTNQSATKLP